jgi:hypothetical protein
VGATVSNIEADQNADIVLTVAVQDDDGTAADLTGFTGAMQVKASYVDIDLLAEATVAVDPDNGLVTATVAAADTLDWTAGYYDLQITDGTHPEYIARGTIRLRPTVTR